MSGLETLVAIAIVLLVLLLAAFTLRGIVEAFGRSRPLGALTGKLDPVETSIEVGSTGTFKLTLTRDNLTASADSQLPAPNTRVGIAVVPDGNLQIVALNRQTVDTDDTTFRTDANGILSIVIRADSVPPGGTGRLVIVGEGTTALTQGKVEIFE